MAASRHEHEEEASWSDLYSINLVPSGAFLKFRKEVQGFRVGLNFEVSSLSLSLSIDDDDDNNGYFSSRMNATSQLATDEKTKT